MSLVQFVESGISNGGAVMPSKQDELRLHIAIFPSVMALASSKEIEKYQVTRIKGVYSKDLQKDSTTPQGKIFRMIYTAFKKIAIVDWKVEQTGKPLTFKEITAEIKSNNIPDIMIEKITFAIPYTQFNNYTMENEKMAKAWTFKPYTFRKGLWNRLKATDFPAKKLYEEYQITKHELLEKLSDVTRKRWRDTILMNESHDELTNQEIRGIWQGVSFALILKESRGSFDLMDMGES